MNWRLIPVVCVMSAHIIQLVVGAFNKSEYFNLEKTLFATWFIWLVLAFYFNKNLPIAICSTYIKNNSEQQTGRGFTTIIMSLLYIVIVGYDIKKMLA